MDKKEEEQKKEEDKKEEEQKKEVDKKAEEQKAEEQEAATPTNRMHDANVSLDNSVSAPRRAKASRKAGMGTGYWPAATRSSNGCCQALAPNGSPPARFLVI